MLSPILLFVVMALSSRGQSQVNFNNASAPFLDQTVDRLVYTMVGGGKLIGTTIAAQLVFAPGANADLNSPTAGIPASRDTGRSTTLAFFRAATTSMPGAWLNPTSAGSTRVLDGIAAGMTATLQVRVWDTAKYDSFIDAFAHGEYSWSAPFNWTGPNPGDPPSANTMEGLRAFATIPEPSTITLGVFGAASLVLLRCGTVGFLKTRPNISPSPRGRGLG